MTTLYRPVLIESAEQAEALPEGAILFDGDPEDGDTYVRVGGEWHTDGYPGLLSEALDLGFTVTALVPMESEEVHPIAYGLLELDMHGRADVNHDVTDPRPYRRTEYLTPWEEA